LPSANGKMTGDITPEYCMIGEKGVEYVRGLLGDIKIIIMVRDPVDRALSQIRMNAKNQKIDLASASLAQWMALATDPVIYTRARYSEFIPLWARVFGINNILILSYNQVVDLPAELLRKTEEFLGISCAHYAEAAKRVHESANRQIPAPEEVFAHLARNFVTETQYLKTLMLE